MLPVLIVEDHVGLTKALRRFVRPRRADHAKDARKALALLRTRRYACLLVDLHLEGGTDGPDVVEAARRLDPRPPVAVVTGVSNPHVTNRCGELGALLFRKPLLPESLTTLLELAAEHDARVSRPPAAHRIHDAKHALLASLATPLPSRPLELLDALLAGETLDSFARTHGIKKSTAAEYATLLHRTTGFKSSEALVRSILHKAATAP